MSAPLPFPFPLEAGVIRQRRADILAQLCRMDAGFAAVPVKQILHSTLPAMLRLYDDAFLGGFLSRAFGSIDVTLSSRLTSSAGKFICDRRASVRMQHAEIRMSSDFLARLEKGSFSLNGLTAESPQEAFLIVFEHELCHALETALYGSTGHSMRFLSLANGLFGHTATRHSLPTRRQEAAETGLSVGRRARFAYQGRQLTGVITYVGKTATVMVPDSRGAYRDRQGHRYAKFRVPLPLLMPCE